MVINLLKYNRLFAIHAFAADAANMLRVVYQLKARRDQATHLVRKLDNGDGGKFGADRAKDEGEGKIEDVGEHSA